eukprot:CAMPEP_0117449144 /NCGR_PEP_ID=MMETSP0759-20121206/7788_1 /TAXON_ID=63605 /ORGANISM="Percolomonas cosmopolitus, Strain WS" /LENGTH=260 /DNA_ID=CAMNT_0005241599 /DNA_START=11 /DNA_END=793 /DNA_ORIENTATION=+
MSFTASALNQKESQWKQIQSSLKQKLSLSSSFRKPITHIAGLDISFSKVAENGALASLVVLDYRSLAVVYKSFHSLTLTEPYIAGYLAFREVDSLCLLWREMREKIERGELVNDGLQEEPQVALIDGNGIHHMRGFGLACHFGVLMDVPSIGVAKSLLCLDGLTHEKVKELQEGLKKGGDHALLKGKSGTEWSALLKGSDKGKNCVFVSPGHRVDMNDSVRIVAHCCKFKNPEPVRQADLLSREEIRVMDRELAKQKGGE